MLSPQECAIDGLTIGNGIAVESHAQPKNMPIAVIGYAGRFPQAENTAQFWHNLDMGIDGVGDIPADRWDGMAYFDKRPATALRTYCRQGGFIKNIHMFDNAFFSISEDEARCMDPKQRLLIQTVYHGLEHAGYGGEAFCGTDTGVFIGSSYYHHEHEMPANKVISPFGMLGTSNTLLANRISHMFDFKGPSCFIDTFCSSSLMAVHLACQSLGRGECRTALAGGVNLLSLIHYISLSQFRALSASGRCRTFDKAADGFVPGEGVGIVLLKPLQAALDDHDTVHGVIKGAATNHTGRTNSLTSPSAESQSRLIKAAYANAGVGFDSISYIETHGTGTELGDPLEIKALKNAFKDKPRGRDGCVLGSVKTSIGHLEPASGIAGLIKVLLCMKHKRIPGVLHLNHLNRFINLKDTPFKINTETIEWKCLNGPRRAGISSFGLSGTNVHMVVEEPPEPMSGLRPAQTKQLQLYTLSARNRTALRHLARDSRHILDQYADDALDDICYTQAVGRRHFDMRASILCNGIDELKKRLEGLVQSADNDVVQKEGVFLRTADAQQNIAMVFEDDYHTGMEDLSPLRSYAVFCKAFNQATAEIRKYLPADKYMATKIALQHSAAYPDPSFPYLRLATSYAVIKLLCSWGIDPILITGRGAGLVPAALVANAICWKTALALEDKLVAGIAAEAQMIIECQPAIALVASPDRPADQGVKEGDCIRLNPVVGSPVSQTFSAEHTTQPLTLIQLGGKNGDNLLAGLPEGANFVHICGCNGSIWSSICTAVGKLHAGGVSIDWHEFYHPHTPARVPLANYPFEAHPLDFERKQGATIMEMLFDHVENGHPVSTAQVKPATSKQPVHKASRPTDTDALTEYLFKAVSRKTNVAVEEICPDSSFEEIGMDSILKVELSYEILEQFSELEQAGNALVAAETINEFIDIMRDNVDELPGDACERPEDEPPAPDLESLHAGQKRSPRNLASQVVRVAEQRLTADLVVDEQHAFFFDHPLDHVSGVHQLEAMVQTVTTAQYALGYQHPYDSLFFKDVHVDFKHLCPKTGSARIEAKRLNFIEGCKDTGLYTANIQSDQIMYCNAFFKVQALDADEPVAQNSRALSPTVAAGFTACEKSKVHKLNSVNVLISEPVLSDDTMSGMRFALRPVGDHLNFSDYSGNHVPSIYFLEAFRQTQRYLQHLQEVDSGTGRDLVSFLLSLTLSLNRPVGRHEAVDIEIDHVDPKSVGKNLLVAGTGRILHEGVELGSCSTQSIVLKKK